MLIQDKSTGWSYTISNNRLVQWISIVQTAIASGGVVRINTGIVIPPEKTKTLLNILLRIADQLKIDLTDVLEKDIGIDMSKAEPVDVEDL